ncbi:uncharacterized protein LOC132260096 [Phlebotomus argentipes]|uniref:uncharacterized protein LOC132260096 n=1 Tax=Phlebotomus argentipes TaxID=94469 RepID=UPI002892EF95|nr:uncharacterized protein LOC132260096 [Phlebotomus argentipes]
MREDFVRWLFVLAVAFQWRNGAEALRCYACTYVSGQQSDTVCIDDPEKVEGQRIVTCDKKYCTIMRQELKDPAGKVNSFVRDCVESPQFLNDMIEDATFKTYFRSCMTDLCNDGDGIRNGDSILNPDGNGPGENLLVPGITGKATLTHKIPAFLTLTLTLFVQFVRRLQYFH